MATALRAAVNTAPFQPIVDMALTAFELDFGYLEQILQAANVIAQSREVWSYRTEARSAEETAKKTCAEVGHACVSVSPCGFGDCAFATPENARVCVISTSGRNHRLSESAYPSYDRELVVTYVRALRRTA